MVEGFVVLSVGLGMFRARVCTLGQETGQKLGQQLLSCACPNRCRKSEDVSEMQNLYFRRPTSGSSRNCASADPRIP